MATSFNCGKTQDFIVSINITRSGFHEKILPRFQTERKHVNFGGPYCKTVKQNERRPQLESHNLLGLALWYLKCKDRLYKLSFIFGIVPSSIPVWLDYALEFLLRVVSNNAFTECRLEWPSFQEMENSAALFQRNRKLESYLPGVFGVMDGGRMPVVKCNNMNLQNAYFEGFTQCTEVTNIFVFTFDGLLIHAAIKFPGS